MLDRTGDDGTNGNGNGTAGNGYQADHHQILSCATKLSSLQRQARQTADLARTANPDVMTLGALGEVIWQLVKGASDRMHDHLEEVHEGLGRYAAAMDCTGRTYQAVEEHHVRELSRLNGRVPE